MTCMRHGHEDGADDDDDDEPRVQLTHKQDFQVGSWTQVSPVSLATCTTLATDKYEDLYTVV